MDKGSNTALLGLGRMRVVSPDCTLGLSLKSELEGDGSMSTGTDTRDPVEV